MFDYLVQVLNNDEFLKSSFPLSLRAPLLLLYWFGTVFITKWPRFFNFSFIKASFSLYKYVICIKYQVGRIGNYKSRMKNNIGCVFFRKSILQWSQKLKDTGLWQIKVLQLKKITYWFLTFVVIFRFAALEFWIFTALKSLRRMDSNR